MFALALVAAVALAGESLPPQNQPVNITQIKGSPVGNTNPLPITCVSGCGGGGSGGGAVDQGSPAQIDGGWPVILVDQLGHPLGTVSFPLQVAGGGSGGGGSSWDAGVIVQFPVAIASLWDGGVVVQNFPAVQSVSQDGVWVVNLDPDGGVNVLNFPTSFGATQDGPWTVTAEIDPDGGPLAVVCVAGCGGGSGGGGASWDAGVVVQNFPASFGSSQVGDWSFLLVYDGGPLPVTVVGGSGTGWDAGVLVQNDVTVLQGGGWDVSGSTVAVLQDTSPWLISGSVTQSGNWSELMVYDGGPLPVSGAVTVSGTVTAAQGTSPWVDSSSQAGNWAELLIYDGGPLPVSGSVTVSGSVSVSNFPATQPVSGTVAVSNFPTVQAVSLVDSGIPGAWDGGYLAYTYAGPLPADTSYQTSCTMAMVLCGTTSTSLGTCAGGKWQDFQNQSTQSIYICPVAGCSAPTAIDAGTTIGEQVQPSATYFANGSAAYWCVVPTSPQVSPDAGTVVKCCK